MKKVRDKGSSSPRGVPHSKLLTSLGRLDERVGSFLRWRWFFRTIVLEEGTGVGVHLGDSQGLPEPRGRQSVGVEEDPGFRSCALVRVLPRSGSVPKSCLQDHGSLYCRPYKKVFQHGRTNVVTSRRT